MLNAAVVSPPDEITDLRMAATDQSAAPEPLVVADRELAVAADLAQQVSL